MSDNPTKFEVLIKKYLRSHDPGHKCQKIIYLNMMMHTRQDKIEFSEKLFTLKRHGNLLRFKKQGF